jgi:DNA-binding response OmpR family regulator
MATRVLIIDDDASLSEMLAEYLESNGLEVTSRGDARTGIKALESETYDALVLDVMLPDLDGFEVCRKVRESSSIPILMLTARGEETDRIVGLELGADDYLPKPFNPRELLARLRAVLRRARSSSDELASVFRFGRLEIDLGARILRIGDEEKTLTGHQFDLLVVLARNAGRVLSRDQLMNAVQGRDIEAFDRSIDTHISRIRAAIEDEARRPRRLLTVRGTGYVFARSQDREVSD